MPFAQLHAPHPVLGAALFVGSIRGQFPFAPPEADPEARVHELLLLLLVVVLLLVQIARGQALIYN